jgi:peptidoglycan-associated lipoprotein
VGEVQRVLAAIPHFDFDKATIRPGDARAPRPEGPVLQVNPSWRIRIAGNCDESGSDEYNHALGNRRIAAKQYLESHGIDAGRVEVVS